jgi:molybdenum cofactor guanylyltransferase
VTDAISVVVLAGGRGARMGRDKRTVTVGGRPLLRLALDLAADLSDDVILSCRASDPPPIEALAGTMPRTVFDRRGEGPLAGIEAGLAAAAHDVSIVIPVDMPRLGRPLVELLVDAAAGRPEADGAVFEGDDRGRCLPAALRRSSLAVVSAQLDAGRLRLRDTLDLLDLVVVPADRITGVASPDAFRNINYPADLEPGDRPDPAESRDTRQSPEERNMNLESCLAAVRAIGGAGHVDPAAPTEQEVEALLDFTRAVAHAGERKDAPLAAFAMGVAMAGLEPAERADVLSRAAQAVDRAAGNTAE